MVMKVHLLAATLSALVLVGISLVSTPLVALATTATPTPVGIEPCGGTCSAGQHCRGNFNGEILDGRCSLECLCIPDFSHECDSCIVGQNCRGLFGGEITFGRCTADCSCFLEGTPPPSPQPDPTPSPTPTLPICVPTPTPFPDIECDPSICFTTCRLYGTDGVCHVFSPNGLPPTCACDTEGPTRTIPPPCQLPPTPTPTPTAQTPLPTPIPPICIGDCNGDGTVTVDEILVLVNIALGDTPLSTCSVGDVDNSGDITIVGLITSVNNALNDCLVLPTPTPTPAGSNLIYSVTGEINGTPLSGTFALSPPDGRHGPNTLTWDVTDFEVHAQGVEAVQTGEGSAVFFTLDDTVTLLITVTIGGNVISLGGRGPAAIFPLRWQGLPVSGDGYAATISAAPPTPTPPPGLCRNSNDCTRQSDLCLAPGAFAGCGPTPAPVPTYNQCRDDADCAKHAANSICVSVDRISCYVGFACIPGCASDSDCPSEQLCDPSHRCADRACATDADCPPVFTCAHTCTRRMCSSDADCFGGVCVKQRYDPEAQCYDTFGTCVPIPA